MFNSTECSQDCFQWDGARIAENVGTGRAFIDRSLVMITMKSSRAALVSTGRRFMV